ncbi:MerR family transcriptional regulator [Actinokineospora pegani]|uniref:MerR family transcriptional regulator n=1 Tax=Actinokineospora pegani TaxID=2654637 RepID=UPI0012E9F11D|nr:MerR family transcriptional regulator [Actinokineospora pegani]
MRIAELSKRSGVAVATIKYYLREGVLPPGERTSPNQADYSEKHQHRLRLVRALVEVGGLSIAGVRDVLGTVDAPQPDLTWTLSTVQLAMFPIPEATEGPTRSSAEDTVTRLLDDLGWSCPSDHPAAQALAAVLATADDLGHPGMADLLPRYARAAGEVAKADLDYIDRSPSLDDAAEGVAVGTVLGDSMLAALRRMAQVSESINRYGEKAGAKPG